MMNRPRPRKIVSVIKSSPSTEVIEEKQFEDKNVSENSINERKLSSDSSSNEFKSQSPVVPTFSSGTSRPSTSPVSTNSSNSATFVPRKPVVATLKKANVPPAPTFSDSPKSSPISVTKSEKIEFEQPVPISQPLNGQVTSSGNLSSPVNKSHSPKSSGESFLDAADIAADFIGGAFLNSFKSFNLNDTSSVKMSTEVTTEEEDPFADIMKKLKSEQKPKSPVNEPVLTSPPAIKSDFVNLMDEEPPETFEKFNEPIEIVRKSSIKTKQSEPSSFIKAAFSPKPKEEPIKTFGKDHKEVNTSFTNEEHEEVNIIDSVVKNEPTRFNFESKYKGLDPKEDQNELKSESTEPIITDSADEDIRETCEETKDVIEENFVNEEIKCAESKNIFTYDSTFSSGPLANTNAHDNKKDDEKFTFESDNNNVGVTFQSSETQFSSIPPTFEAPKVYAPTPVINFDGSISSGPSQTKTESIEQFSSTSTIPFFDSLSSIIGNSDSSSISSPSTSSIKSPSSPQSKTTGFRASILKHGLSALEKIGKSTADVVVSTRNKLAEPSIAQFTSNQQKITPDFTDENSSFYDILKLYGGYTKLQELQLKGVRASISMKLARKNEKNIERISSFDYQNRLKIRREISCILHSDKIMDLIDDADPSNLLFLAENEFNAKFPNFSKFDDEIFCVQKLLKSLDSILIISSDEDVLVSSNRRRHTICQISTVFCSLLQQLIQIQLNSSISESSTVAKEISLFTSQIIKYLQTNFARNCEDYPRADRDQQLAIKLFLDISYSAVPQLQFYL